MIVGTAGHIDHGKSSLVAALTGRSMDRLAEEQQRGITIELGFAPFVIGDGRIAGVVDVPGHEDFVRTMVAGASGVDLALLVVAADEGIMPQTLEHLLVLEQLGVPLGLPVLTKIDLVDPDWLNLVAEDLMDRLARSPISFEPPARVSTRNGEGVDELRDRLRTRLAALPPRPRDDLFRLPVDRAFSVAGIGTVVTGTCWSGVIAVGDAIRMLPSGREGRVRSIESHGSPAAARPGARTAIGIAGLDRVEVTRGDIAVSPSAPWMKSRTLDVRLDLAATAPRPIGRRQRVRLHLGTGEWIGWASPRGLVAPGGSGMARITLERDIVARGADRFVLRSFSPVTTIGGGEILDPSPPLRGALWPPELADGGRASRLRALVHRRRHGAPARALPVLLGASPQDSGRLALMDASLVKAADQWIAASTVERLAARVASVTASYHQAHPAERGAPAETVRQMLRVPAWLAQAAVARAAGTRGIVVDEALIRLPGFRASGAAGAAEVDLVVDAVEQAGLTPPTVAELAASLKRPAVATTLRVAALGGRVEAVERDRYYGRAALDRFVEVVVELGASGEVGVSALRDRLGLSRKFLIPLLEWADARGVTVRTGDVRTLRKPRLPGTGGDAPNGQGAGAPAAEARPG